MSETRYALGQAVEYTWWLTRRSETEQLCAWKRWRHEAYLGQPEPAPTRGIVVGIRTLSNGKNVWSGSDEAITYSPREFFTAYLVAHNLRQRPVFVLPEHMRPVS